MANAKSVLDIDINDEQFQDFFKQFQEYEKLLASLPDEWKAVNKSLSGAAETFAASAASVETIAESMRGATVSQDRFHAAAQRSDRTMASLASHARSAAHSIGSIAKWAGLTSGIGGGLAMFGMDRLASSIFGQSFSARGLGVTTGEQSAFGINYGAFADSNSLLGKVANARNDMSQWAAFSALGINPAHMAGLDNADLARLVMSRARDKWRTGPQNLQYAQAMGLTQFFSMEDLRRLGTMSDQQLRQANAGYGADRTALTIPEDMQRKWVEFEVQLRRAGLQIESTFIRGLAQVTPGLQHLSAGVSGVIEAFFGSDGVKEGIAKFGKWLGNPATLQGAKDFAHYLGSKEFTDGLHTFGTGLKALGVAIGDMVKFVTSLLPASATKQDPDRGAGWTKGFWDRVMHGDSRALHELWSGDPFGIGMNKPGPSRGPLTGRIPDYLMKQDFAYAGSKFGVPPQLLWNLYGAESSFGRDASTSKKGAIGVMQFMPATARQYGIDPTNAEQSAYGAAHLLSDLFAKYHDWKKAVAAYNWSPRGLDADIAQHGAAWEKFLPDETRGELAKVFPGQSVNPYTPGYLTPMQQRDREWLRAQGKSAAPQDRPIEHTPTGGDLASVLTKLRQELAKQRGSKPVQVSINNDTAARVAVTANAVAS